MFLTELCLCFQEWPHSPVLLALQTGRKADPTADTGARASHPEGAHLQGELSHTKLDTHTQIQEAGNHTRRLFYRSQTNEMQLFYV